MLLATKPTMSRYEEIKTSFAVRNSTLIFKIEYQLLCQRSLQTLELYKSITSRTKADQKQLAFPFSCPTALGKLKVLLKLRQLVFPNTLYKLIHRRDAEVKSIFGYVLATALLTDHSLHSEYKVWIPNRGESFYATISHHITL